MQAPSFIPIRTQHNFKVWGQNQRYVPCYMIKLVFDPDPLLKNGSRAPVQDLIYG